MLKSKVSWMVAAAALLGLGAGSLIMAWIIARELKPQDAPGLLRLSRSLLAASGSDRSQIVGRSREVGVSLRRLCDEAAVRTWKPADERQYSAGAQHERDRQRKQHWPPWGQSALGNNISNQQRGYGRRGGQQENEDQRTGVTVDQRRAEEADTQDAANNKNKSRGNRQQSRDHTQGERQPERAPGGTATTRRVRKRRIRFRSGPHRG